MKAAYEIRKKLRADNNPLRDSQPDLHPKRSEPEREEARQILKEVNPIFLRRFGD